MGSPGENARSPVPTIQKLYFDRFLTVDEKLGI